MIAIQWVFTYPAGIVKSVKIAILFFNLISLFPNAIVIAIVTAIAIAVTFDDFILIIFC